MRIAGLLLVAGCSFQPGNAPSGLAPPPPGADIDASTGSGSGSGSGSATIDAAVPVDTPAPRVCPPGYNPLPGAPPTSKYRIFSWDSSPGHSNAYSFNTAAQVCANDATHLAIIDNDAEASALGMAIKVNPQSPYYWDGVTDAAQEGQWKTVLGQTAGYLPWGQMEPNGGTQANCAITYKGHIYDWYCTTPYPFACECE